MYPHNKVPEWRDLDSVLMIDMNMQVKIYTPSPINNMGQDITFTHDPLGKLGDRFNQTITPCKFQRGAEHSV